MRLIDADEIQRQRIKDVIDAIVDSTPTVDAVEVVRCKDCKHWKETVNGVPTCQGHGIAFITQAEDYCSYGERKEDEIQTH